MTSASSRRIHRLLLPDVSSSGQTIDLSDEIMHYTSRVLRILDGASINAWNGKGQIFAATLHYRSKKLAQVETQELLSDLPPKELSAPVFLLQGLPEGDKLEWILEKCTEMGAFGFLPVQATRSVVKLNPERANKKGRHWQKVIESAANQCEREFLPRLAPTETLHTALRLWKEDYPQGRVLAFSPESESPFSQWLKKALASNNTLDPILICVGPEGGWAPDEIAIFNDAQAEVLNFSPRILRTETFGLACLSQLVLGLGLEPSSPTCAKP